MNQRQTDILKDLDDLRRRSRFSPEAWIATDEAGESVELTPADESRILDEFERDRREIEATPGHLAAALRAYQSEEDPETRREILRRASTWATAFEDYRHARPLNAPETWPGVTPDDLDGLDVPQEPERILEPSQDREKAKGKRGRPKGSTAPAEELIHRLNGNAKILAIWRERTKNLKEHPTQIARETLAAIIASGGEITFKTKGESLRKAVSQELKTDVSRRTWDKTTERYILAFGKTPDPTNVKERDEINQLSNYYK